MTRTRGNKQNKLVEIDAEAGASRRDSFDLDEFLEELRRQMQSTLHSDAQNTQKVSLGDYLKLIALIEERRRTSAPAQREIIVRWEEPTEQGNACN